MPLPLTIIFCLCYGYLLAHIILREIKAAKEKRMHVNEKGELTNGFKTGFGGKANIFNEEDIYK